MPHGEPDATDPMVLNGVVVETDSDEAMREMAACFVEEYLRMDFDADRILRMFQTKGYAGPNLAYRTLGEPAIRTMIDQQIQIRGPHAATRPPVAKRTGEGDVTLTVLDT